MRAKDIMTPNVISIRPDEDVRTASKILADKGISGIPVIDAKGALVGMLSEGDLLRRVELGTQKRRSWWLDLFTFPDGPVADYLKSHARKVADLMTRQVITADEATPLGELATIMERNQIKRVPIMRDNKIVGIVSRANLVRALAARSSDSLGDVEPNDQDLRGRVLDQMAAQPYGTPWLITVIVENGVVTLWGPTESDLERRALRVAAEATPGVREVKDCLFAFPRSGD